MALCSGIQWGIIMPSFPLFLDGMGASIALIGVIAASRTLPQMILRLPFAVISDRLQSGKKYFMIIGLVFQLTPPTFFVFVTNSYQVMFLFLIDGIAESAFWPSMFAHMAELGTRNKSGEAMGALTFGWGSGFAIGTAIVGILISEWGYRVTYLIAASMGFLTLPFFLLAFETVKKSLYPPETRLKKHYNPMKSFKILIATPSVLLAISSGILDTAISSTVQTFLPLYTIRGGLSEIQIGALFTANALASSIVRYPVGKLSDNINRRFLLIIGTAFTSLGVLIVPFTLNFKILAILLVFAGIGSGISLPTRLALMLDAAPHQKALATALTTTFVQMSMSVTPAILGVVGSRKGLNAPFIIVSSFSLLILTFIVIITRKMGRRTKKTPQFDVSDIIMR